MTHHDLPAGPELDRLIVEKVMGWTCKACGGNDSMKSSGGYLQCRQCHRARGRKWAAQNRHRRAVMSEASKLAFAKYRKRWALKKRYGITLEKYNEMMERCGGRCEVCQRDTKRLHVDHDHTTGFVRGLLCQGCNFSIGYAYDSPQTLRAAADYICRAAVAALP